MSLKHLAVCFSANKLLNPKSVQLYDGVVLRPSSAAESARIDSSLDEFFRMGYIQFSHPLLGNWKLDEKSSRNSFEWTQPPRNYLVLDVENPDLVERCVALLLISDRSLTVGLMYPFANGEPLGVHFWQEEMRKPYPNPLVPARNLEPVSNESQEEYVALFESTMRWENTRWEPHLRRIANYSSAEMLKHDSGFRMVAHFSILEGMLAHKPKPTDTTESISRQIKRKLLLLKNVENFELTTSGLTDRPIDFTTVWSELYGIRSEVVHGDGITLKRNKFAFKDIDGITDYVARFARFVTRTAMLKPQLIDDLRAV
jgi:hypothetical protein